VELKLSFIDDQPIGVDLDKAAIVGLLYSPDVDGLVAVDQHRLSPNSNVLVQEMVFMVYWIL
jgi:hypothetical protein